MPERSPSSAWSGRTLCHVSRMISMLSPPLSPVASSAPARVCLADRAVARFRLEWQAVRTLGVGDGLLPRHVRGVELAAPRQGFAVRTHRPLHLGEVLDVLLIQPDEALQVIQMRGMVAVVPVPLPGPGQEPPALGAFDDLQAPVLRIAYHLSPP